MSNWASGSGRNKSARAGIKGQVVLRRDGGGCSRADC
jgi:hypothetical protein